MLASDSPRIERRAEKSFTCWSHSDRVAIFLSSISLPLSPSHSAPYVIAALVHFISLVSIDSHVVSFSLRSVLRLFRSSFPFSAAFCSFCRFNCVLTHQVTFSLALFCFEMICRGSSERNESHFIFTFFDNNEMNVVKSHRVHYFLSSVAAFGCGSAHSSSFLLSVRPFLAQKRNEHNIAGASTNGLPLNVSEQ